MLALAMVAMWPGSRAEAQCATTQAGAGNPVSYTCATNTATTPRTNGNPNNPSTSERNQVFATSVNGQINSGVTVSVNGVSLVSRSTTPGAVVTMVNNGVISNSTNGQAALSIGTASINNFGTFTYSGTGNITNTGTTAGSSGLSIVNATGTGGTNVTVSGTISSVADLGIQVATSTGANSLTVQTGGMVSGAAGGVQISGGGTNMLTNSGTIQGTGASSSGVVSFQDLALTNSGSITGVSAGVTAGASSSGMLSLTNNVGSSIAATGTGGVGIIAGTPGALAGGGLTGSNAGIISGDGGGIKSTGAVNLSSNSGTISGTGAAGVGISATGVTISANTGTISGGDTAISSTSVNPANDDIKVTNSSVISGGNTGISGDGALNLTNNKGATVSGGTSGISVTGSLVMIGNSGTISAGANGTAITGGPNMFITNNASGLIQAGADGSAIVGGNLTLNNSGTVMGSGGGTVGSTGVSTFGTTNVTNSGTISAAFDAIDSSGVTTVTNKVGGVIRASLAGDSFGILTSAATTVINNGMISGDRDGINTSTSDSTTVTNSGTISGATRDGVRVNTASVTNNAGGMISGTTGVLFRDGNGASTVFNAGTIAGTGGTAIQFSAGSMGNMLTIAPTSAINGNVMGAGQDIFQLGGSGSGTFNVGNIGASQQYQGFATFNKVDASTWILTGTGNQSWTVSQGILGGTATIAALNVQSGGTFMPGNGTPGTALSVTGNLAFQSGAQYMVQVSPTASSFTSVTGTATLGNATVNVSFTNGSSFAKRYTILTAGSINGTFNNSVTSNLPSNVHETLSYDANHAFLDLTLSFATPGGLNGNQQQVSNALTNAFNTNGTIPMAFASLTPAGLTQASGETATGSQQSTFNAMTQFMELLTDLSIGGRGEAPPSTTPPQFADDDDGASAYAARGRRLSGNERDAFASIYRKAPATADTLSHRWNVWAAGFGGSQTTDGNATLGSNATTSHLFGGAAGADYWLSPSTLTGFALAGGGTGFSVANGLGSGRSDLFQAGAYIRHTAGAAYFSGALAYGWQDITTDRTVTIAGIDRLQAEFNANAFSGRVEGGYRFATPWMVGLSPYAAAQFTTFNLPAYAERVLSGTNTFALAYAAKDITASRSELGFRSDKSWAMQDGILTLRGRFAWAHDFNTDRNVGATFQTLLGASFVVNGAAQAHDAALTTASAEMKWLNGVSLGATFEGEFSSVTRSYAGKGVARYSW